MTKTAKTTTEIEALVRQASGEVRTIFTTIGPNEEANKAEMRVYCTTVDQRRPIPQWDIQKKLSEALRQVPGLKFGVVDPGVVVDPVG